MLTLVFYGLRDGEIRCLVLPATLDEHGGDALFGEGAGALRGVGGRGVHGDVGGYSAVISVTAERAEDSSTMALLAA